MHHRAAPTVFTLSLHRKQEKNGCYEGGLRHEVTDCHLPYPWSQEPFKTFLNPTCSKLRRKTVFTFSSICHPDRERAELWIEERLQSPPYFILRISAPTVDDSI